MPNRAEEEDEVEPLGAEAEERAGRERLGGDLPVGGLEVCGALD